MEIEKLCPGCMRETDSAMHRRGAQENAETAARDGRNASYVKIQNRRKCPYCGFDASVYRQNARCLPINTILAGKYLVGAVLGEGGFGITYMGYDLNMETRIAIKEYFPVELVSRDTTSMTGDRVISMGGDKSVTYKQGLKKYVTEAQNVSRFAETPGVVSVKDFFYENETAYIVMEYIDGISLKDYLKERGGRLSEEESLTIMKPVLEALVKVHEAGIIHRDISPDNIMLTFSDGQDYCMPVTQSAAGGEISSGDCNQADCGSGAGQRIASGQNGKPKGQRTVGTGETTANAGKAAGDSRRIDSVRLIDFGAARMTARDDQKSLTIILKHGYAPEEQYRTHGEQGPWTDVYAVCAVLYRMLTGETPVPAMDRLFQDSLKSFDDLSAKVTRKTQTAILRGLTVKKETRIQTVAELIDALYGGNAIKDASAGRHRKSLAIAIAAVSGVLLLSVMIFLPLIRNSAPAASSLQEGQGKEEPELTADTTKTEQNGTGESRAAESEDTDQEGKGTDDSGETGVQWEDETETGLQIVWPKPETMIAAGDSHVLSLREDGTVLAAGNNEAGQCEVSHWDHVAAVYADGDVSAGLRTDGRIYITENYFLSQEAVDSWRGVVSLALTSGHVIGLREDGTVISAGQDNNGCCDVGDWTDIESVAVGPGVSVGVTKDGDVRIAGILEGEEDTLEDVEKWTDISRIFVLPYGTHVFYGLKKDGTMLLEPSEEGNLFAGRTDVSYIVSANYGFGGLLKDGTVLLPGNSAVNPQDAGTDIAAIAHTNFDIIALGYDGRIKIMGSGMNGSSILEEINSSNRVVQTVWGEEIVAILYDDGTVRMAGMGKSDADVDEWTDISQIGLTSMDGVAGLTHDKSVVIAEPGTTSAGNDFPEGLSHEERMEELDRRLAQTPDLVKDWENVKEISCSDRHIAALMEDGTVRTAGYVFNQATTDYRTGLTKDGACETEDFTGIRQVVATTGMTIGLREDGTLITAGNTWESWEGYDGIASIWKGGRMAVAAIREDGTLLYLRGEGMNAYGEQNTVGWDNLVQLALSDKHTVGLRSDGTVLATGSNYCGQCEVSGWTDVVSISAGPSSTMGITSDGKVLMAGTFPNDYSIAEQWPAVSFDGMMKENP